MIRTYHQKRVDQFMKLAKQELPSKPCIPSEEVRMLRAKLIMEEALETINALGIWVNVLHHGIATVEVDGIHVFEFKPDLKPNLVEIADGCADLSVVTIGTLSACGIDDLRLLSIVDDNNMAKFGEGHSIREDGKLVKPPGHKPPDIEGLLRNQGWNG